MVASEKIAFQQYTDSYVSVDEGEVILLDLNNREKFWREKGEKVKRIEGNQKVQIKQNEGYGSWFEQEMEEQPEALLRALGNGARLAGSQEDAPKLGGLEQHKEELIEIQNLLIIGCGTSLYAGQYVSNFIKKMKIFTTVSCIEASDFTEHDIPLEKAGAIFISQSGETKDVYAAVMKCKKHGLFTLGVVNVVGSLIATTVHCGVYVNS